MNNIDKSLDEEETPKSHWNFRLMEHRHATGNWCEVHEIHYDDGKPSGFATRSYSPRSKFEAEKMVHAFTQPIIGWVDENTCTRDEMGFPDYEESGWFTEEKFWNEEEYP